METTQIIYKKAPTVQGLITDLRPHLTDAIGSIARGESLEITLAFEPESWEEFLRTSDYAYERRARLGDSHLGREGQEMLEAAIKYSLLLDSRNLRVEIQLFYPQSIAQLQTCGPAIYQNAVAQTGQLPFPFFDEIDFSELIREEKLGKKEHREIHVTFSKAESMDTVNRYYQD